MISGRAAKHDCPLDFVQKDLLPSVEAVRFLDNNTTQATDKFAMAEPLVNVDDKFLPLYRILWVAATPHFCGEEDCMREGQYEIRLEMDESLWASGDERDHVLKALANWCGEGVDGPENDGPGLEDDTPPW